MTQGSTGRFFVIEGIDGCGKSTQVERLVAQQGWLATREPGGTELGATIRGLILHGSEAPTPLAEALLMAADRAHHVATVIRPALESGTTVLCDRYAGSTVAYQGWGHQGDLDQISAINAIATGGLLPNRTILLDVPVDVALGRRGSDPDRLEALDTSFHERVRAGYLAQAAKDRDRWTVVDGTDSLAEVSAAVDRALGL
ncbi:MAG: dTMP kinase [Actinomycetes bacterium]